MRANEVIYHIKQIRHLTEIWKEFSRQEKEDVIRRMANQETIDLEKVLLEVKTGQNRLF
jgi:hypothetical protein